MLNMVLSASRRTDIPAFYGKWLLNRLRAGEVAVRNPMNPKQVTKLLFDPDCIECIVFWTKDPAPFFQYLHEIDSLGYKYYFQFSLTPYGKDIEKNLNKSHIVETFIELSELIGKEKVIWRYDPIIVNDKHLLNYHLEKFELAAERLHSYTEKCVISFVDEYPFLLKTFETENVKKLDDEQMNILASGFSKILSRYMPKLELATCCEKIELEKYNIVHNKCIDDKLISKITGKSFIYKKDSSQRKECGCTAGRDIGVYNTCLHDCIYCYAKRGQQKSEMYNENDIALCEQIHDNDKVTIADLRK